MLVSISLPLAQPEGSRQRGFSYARRKGLVIEHTEQVEHHRWTSPDPLKRGLAPLDGPTRALLHQLRWRKAPPNRRRQGVALGLVLLLHGLFGLLTWHELRLHNLSAVAYRRDHALQVRLIPRPAIRPTTELAPLALPPPPAPIVAMPHEVVKPPPVHEAPAKSAMTVSMPPAAPAPAPAPAPQPYEASPQPPLPSASSAAAAEAPGYVQRMPQGDAKVMQHASPITYKPTRFEEGFSHGGSSVDDALQRAVDSTTVKKTFHIAPGVRIHCAISFAALAGGCGGDPPPPPSSKSADMRLNMAPASALAPSTSTPPPPSVDECIAIYRADKPLPQGCPVDTPTRSVDAELRERAAHPAEQSGG
ncbi:hypothetical protein [Dyella halodurans]|uniref:Energy transducer TonB n=1 Tax=Dyella halodurans TaxID=1920171 RepID=A0ABV9C711_9GAMM|nr:hypothetical protein [Dyella halodurans]